MKRFSPYNNIRNYLFQHKKLPLFLSHGAIHLTVLILLLILTGWLGYNIYKMSIKNFIVIDTSIKFQEEKANENFPLRHFEMKIKAHPTENIDTVFMKGIFFSIDDVNFKYSDIRDKQVVWTWINNYPNSILWYNYTGSNITKGYEDHITTELLTNGFKTTFKDYSTYSLANINTNGNLMAENDLNPYYCALIRFSQDYVDLDSLSSITIDLSKSKGSNTIITFDKILPEPSEIGINSISYEGKDKVEEILKNGQIFFEAKDTMKAYRADKYYLLFSVLIGTLIAFCIDIIIKLIYKWRYISKEK